MGRVALVTGGSRGIGAAISTALKDAGYTVAANYAGNDEAAAKFTAETGIKTYKWSVADYDACAAGVKQVEADLGPVEVLVNNAGLQHVAPLEEFPIAKWDFLVQVMLVGVARLTRALLPGMRERGFGRIVNIGSIHSLVASPYKSAYVAAKHGLLGFSKVVALETAGTDITINTICPTYVKTPLVDRQIADQARTRGIPEAQVVSEVMLKPMPKGVFITFEELAGIAAFLMSPAARNITGHSIDVDGGWTVQ